ncbi:hypothetical protein GGQ80_001344 [Sphingomonas jinjuensis]|uniref:Uncharacterized protein n=1 Tax=Sphingomonas jinjuensis TaxID=535907 RepID=A0A840F9Z2_9SPHN|nr:hypothetical protein [Sphingomonas jinjuensis]
MMLSWDKLSIRSPSGAAAASPVLSSDARERRPATTRNHRPPSSWSRKRRSAARDTPMWRDDAALAAFSGDPAGRRRAGACAPVLIPPHAAVRYPAPRVENPARHPRPQRSLPRRNDADGCPPRAGGVQRQAAAAAPGTQARKHLPAPSSLPGRRRRPLAVLNHPLFCRVSAKSLTWLGFRPRAGDRCHHRPRRDSGARHGVGPARSGPLRRHRAGASADGTKRERSSCAIAAAMPFPLRLPLAKAARDHSAWRARAAPAASPRAPGVNRQGPHAS